VIAAAISDGPTTRWAGAGCSGRGRQRSDLRERADEVVLPRANGPEVKCPLAGGVGGPSGDLQQPAPHGAAAAHGVSGQSDDTRPADQVVSDRGNHGPGAVGVEHTGPEVRERLFFEVTERERDDRVLTLLGLFDCQRFGLVGEGTGSNASPATARPAH
jgi:hypothetical protein